VDKVEYDINVLKTRLGMRESSVTAGEGGMPVSDAMDVDEGNEGNEGNDGDTVDDGRAQSVVSTRSARSRKHVCLISRLQGRRILTLFTCRTDDRCLPPRWIQPLLELAPNARSGLRRVEATHFALTR
jgi:hypothetical protein